jgi:hypothetical protein
LFFIPGAIKACAKLSIVSRTAREAAAVFLIRKTIRIHRISPQAEMTGQLGNLRAKSAR